MSVKRLLWVLALCLGALIQAACGGGADRTKAQVRLVNASPDYQLLEFSVDGQVVQGQVAYGGLASYVEVEPDKAAKSGISQPGAATTLLSFAASVSKDRRYTLLAYGALGALKQLLLEDNQGTPDTNKTLFKVVNAAPDAGALDVYLTGGGDALSASVPVLTGAAFGSPTSAIAVNSGNWRLRVTLNNSKTDLRLDLPALSLSSKQVATLVLTPGRGGALVSALLLIQEAEVSRLDNTQARVRVAAGVTNSGAVTAQLGGVALLSNTSAPVVGNYALVPAGQQSAAITVNGAAIAATPAALAAGGDYTLLVRGAATAATASLIEDDNRLPSDTSLAKLRLVNGLADLPTPLAMTADLVPVANSVAPGLSSPYGTVLPSITASLAVTASGLSKPVLSLGTQTFVAGANYTLFVLGPVDSAAGQLRKDR